MKRVKNLKKLVAKLLLGFTLIVTTSSCQAQLAGKYVLAGGTDYLEFENGRFEETQKGHMGETLLGKGSYEIKGGKLNLSYENFTLENLSYYSLEKTERLGDSESVWVKMHVLDAQDSTHMHLLPIINLGTEGTTLFTDVEGNSSFILRKSEGKFPSILLRFIGYHSLTINLEEHSGAKIDLTCVMSPKSFTPLAEGSVQIPIKVLKSSFTLLRGDESEVYIKTSKHADDKGN